MLLQFDHWRSKSNAVKITEDCPLRAQNVFLATNEHLKRKKGLPFTFNSFLFATIITFWFAIAYQHG